MDGAKSREPILVPQVCPEVGKEIQRVTVEIKQERQWQGTRGGTCGEWLSSGDLVKDAVMRMEMATWVDSLAPWQVIAHCTFRWEASIWSGQRCFEKFMRKEMWGVTYFYALEANPGRDGFHVHAVMADCKSMSRKNQMWRPWHERYGRCRFEPINRREDVVQYCAKYVTKEGAWWNACCASHRRAQDSDGFKLEN